MEMEKGKIKKYGVAKGKEKLSKIKWQEEEEEEDGRVEDESKERMDRRRKEEEREY